MNSRKRAWLALNHIPGAGAVALRRLVSRFESPEAALEAPADELIGVGSLTLEQAREVHRVAADPARFERLAQDLRRSGASVLTIEDDEYPTNLRLLRDAPPLLYVRGSLLAQDQAAVAIVGTRTPSGAGEVAAQAIGKVLASHEVTVVSGLARGIDGAAHRGALAAGRTIAVLGSGIDRVTPKQHRGLAERIVRCGALLSEIPPHARASRESLLARNRIQAGLARAVVVIQCGTRGGSFATARRALQAGRPVFAVCWEEPEFAAGVERLCEMGAQAVTAGEAADLAAECALAPAPAAPQPQMAFDDTCEPGLGD